MCGAVSSAAGWRFFSEGGKRSPSPPSASSASSAPSQICPSGHFARVVKGVWKTTGLHRYPSPSPFLTPTMPKHRIAWLIVNFDKSYRILETKFEG